MTCKTRYNNTKKQSLEQNELFYKKMTPESILKNVFGYNEFRPLQREIISNVIQKKDTLAVMMTGSGKSLCYQIPALIFPGLTIVVSPLISLMKDQIEQLNELGIHALSLNSSLAYEDYIDNIKQLKSNHIRLLYLAPETLLKQDILTLLKSIRVDCLTIDEAHCISEWGHDFRPEYRRLALVRNRFPRAVCIALTATATSRVRMDILNTLEIKKADTYISSFNRKNLFLSIKPKADALVQTINFIDKHGGQAGIIYCLTRKQVDLLAGLLLERGYSVKPYHAGLPADIRMVNQEAFIKDDVQIIIATIAFGMGIHKPDIRFILHYDLPKSIESYYQQIGRAGRDGLHSDCLLLFGYQDIHKVKYFIKQKQEKERKVALKHLDALLHLIESDNCRRIALLSYFGEKYVQANCGMCDNCINPTRDLTDITIPAKMFLSCVKHTGEIFGPYYIINVLMGSKAKKILANRHDRLSTYGSGREYSKKQWYHFSRQFLNQKLIVQNEQYGSLILTDLAYNVFNNKMTVKVKLLPDNNGHQYEKQNDIEKHNVKLFEILRKERKKLADRADIPPYVVFHDRTLIEMSTYFPQSKASLIKIFGVGKTKLDKYGDTLLPIIINYCRQNGINEISKNQSRHIVKSSPKSRKRKYVIIGEAFNKKELITQMMEKYKIKENTVLENLYKYIIRGNTLDAERLEQISDLSTQNKKEIFKVFDMMGIKYLKPVFECFEGLISYSQLKIMRLYYIASSKAEAEK